MTWEKEEKTMKPRIKILLLAVLIAALCNCMLMIGMTKKKENNTIPKDASLICEETVSPNKDYITDEKDLVNYTVRVYQEKNNDIIVDLPEEKLWSKGNQYVEKVFSSYATIIETETKVCPNKKCNLRNYKDDDHLRSSYVEQNAAWIDQVFN